MKKSFIKLGGIIGMAGLIGYTVYSNMKKMRQEEVIDIEVDVVDEPVKNIE